MPGSGEKSFKKTFIQLCIGLLIALVIAVMSFLSKTADTFEFYEMIELKLLDQHFVFRGSIPMDPNVGTIDVDALTLGFEGRYQDWTRDKYARIIRILDELDSRMIGFDVFFPEESSTEILKKEDFVSAQPQSIEDVSGLFRDFDEEMSRAMTETGNVLIGQSFEIADRQDPEWVDKNTAEKNSAKVRALESLRPYSKELPAWKESGLPMFIDIEHPIQKIIDSSKGVGFAMTVADIDGSVRHYPVVLVYDGKVWPSLALMMFLEYIGASFEDIEIGDKEVILPPGTLPDGREVNVRIPLNDDGLMMVNWTGDYWDEQFFHVPHISLLLNIDSWKTAAVEKTIKTIFLEHPEIVEDIPGLLQDPSPLFQAAVENGLELDDTVVETALWLLMCSEIENMYVDGGNYFPEELPNYWSDFIAYETYFDAYTEVSNNHKIAKAFESYPDLTLDEMSDTVNVHPADKIRLGYFILKDKFSTGGLKPGDYPLYFSDPEVNGKVITAGDFRDKVFIYGLTAAGTWDLNPMPYNQRYPMVGLYANIFSMLVTQSFLERADLWINIGILFLFGLVMGLSVPRIKPLMGVLLTLGLLAGFAAFAQYLFEGHGMWIDEFGPLTVILLGYTAITVYNFFSEEKEKKMIRGIFSRYVTKSVVDELIKNPDMVKLGGEKKVLTVFFSDVAGFTTVSEKLEPEELVALLNDYLTEMSNIILNYDGMIDKYEGDAIMAVFGTPIMYGDHATRACYVSLEMQEKLIGMREKWKAEGSPELYVRIGLNTGPMIAGNMGAADRLDYTVMGDSVNLGSRLEGANKQYGTYIMVSESTYEAAKNDIEVRFLDSLRVKGKQQPVKVYELIGRKDRGIDADVSRLRELYEQGIEKYLQRDWDAGLSLFNKALEIRPNDGPSAVYVERIKAYKENPPPPDWDGVFTMTTK